MKNIRFTPLLTAALGLAAFAPTWGAENDISGAAAAPARNGVQVAALLPTFATVHVAVVAGPDLASGTWSEIKDFTFAAREQFFAGLKRLEARVDGQMSELRAKRATMLGTVDTKEWDFQMKEMEEARFYLKSSGEEMHNASPETWDQQKDKIGVAWVRTQEAYAKVKATTTS